MEHNTLKNLVVSFVILLLTGCESNTLGPGDFEQDDSGTLYVSVEPVPKIQLNTNTWQTIKTITGELTSEGIDVSYVRVTWFSDMYWVVGDTTGYFKTNCRECEEGVWYDLDGTTATMSYSFHTMAPVTNQVSIATNDGEINNVLAPVRSMSGDMMWLWWSINGAIADSMQISLQ